MTNHNSRKEPSFGSTIISEDTADYLEKMAQEVKPYISLRSNQSPGYTFTPVLKRPEELFEQPAPPVEQTVERVEITPSQATKEFAFTPLSEPQSNSAPLNVEMEKVQALNMNTGNTAKTKENTVEPVLASASSFTTERVIPNVATGGAMAGVAREKVNPQEPKEKIQMTTKTRRLLLVGLLGLALLVIFFLLRPSTPKTVEELQSQQGSNLPIEFRPVDEAEAKRAEEQARAEQEATKQLQMQQQAQPTTMQSVNEAIANTSATPNANVQPTFKTATKPIETQNVEPKPVISQPVVKPQTQGSVVYQPEISPKAKQKVQPQKSQPQKVERLTPQPPKKVVKVAEKPVKEKETPTKPVVKSTEIVKTVSAKMTAKTLVVPKGVSLMQVFRNNNLNISDVNAMSKVNNVVSNLKAGERVIVCLDSNNRVSEMILNSGHRFIRQANGSYIFK